MIWYFINSVVAILIAGYFPTYLTPIYRRIDENDVPTFIPEYLSKYYKPIVLVGGLMLIVYFTIVLIATLLYWGRENTFVFLWEFIKFLFTGF
jgi:UDP-N-acetylmuramyl pentapeptide phosphotransferase/UDP-N-acetylglucosamine-1-phosphate transferase